VGRRVGNGVGGEDGSDVGDIGAIFTYIKCFVLYPGPPA
jgi:hypothetical protein